MTTVGSKSQTVSVRYFARQMCRAGLPGRILKPRVGHAVRKMPPGEENGRVAIVQIRDWNPRRRSFRPCGMCRVDGKEPHRAGKNIFIGDNPGQKMPVQDGIDGHATAPAEELPVMRTICR